MPKTHRKPTVSLRRDLAALLTHLPIVLTCMVEAAILFAYGIFETFLPIRGINIGLSIWEIGLCISSQIITIAIFKQVLGRFSDRHGRVPQIIGGTFLAGLCMVIRVFAYSFWPLMVVSILLGLSISVVISASASHITDLSQRGCHGSAMGMLGSIMDIGHAAGPMVGGLLAVSFGLTVSLLSRCLVLMASGLCFLFYSPPRICSKSTFLTKKER